MLGDWLAMGKADIAAGFKSGKYEVLEWLMFQMGSVGPMLGQAHHFRIYAPDVRAYFFADGDGPEVAGATVHVDLARHHFRPIVDLDASGLPDSQGFNPDKMFCFGGSDCGGN